MNYPLVMNSNQETEQTLPRKNLFQNIRSYIKSEYGTELLFYILTIGLPLLVISGVVTEPYSRPIPYQLLNNGDNDFVKNLTYNLKDKGETFPTWSLALLGVMAFAIQILLSAKLGTMKDVHATLCLYVIAVGLNHMLTHAMKYYCGYFRPIFYEICKPDFQTLKCEADSKYVRKSFPSGHASTSFCLMTLFTAFLSQKFGVTSSISPDTIMPESTNNEVVIQYRLIQPTPVRRLMSLISFLPMILAFFIAGSRIHDNHHHPADVVGGSVIGTGISIYFHSVWFPSMNLHNIRNTGTMI